jgi:hypothetical protein
MTIKAKEEVFLVIGSMGSDAGYSVPAHGLVHVPSNNPEARGVFETISKSYAKPQEIAQKERPVEQAGR